MHDAQSILHSLPERELLARCLWGEARGEPVEGKLAVAHVVMNRKEADTYYGHSIADVLLRRWQFSCFNENDPNLSQILDLTDKNIELTYCRAIADVVIFERTSNRNADPTGGASHYHTVSTKPSWADSPQMKFLCRIGNHLFYREILKRSAEEETHAPDEPAGEEEKAAQAEGERSIIADAGAVLQSADEALIDMLEEMGGTGTGSGSGVESGETTSTSVAEIAAANQAITNTVSAASQAVSTAKQNDQKINQSR